MMKVLALLSLVAAATAITHNGAGSSGATRADIHYYDPVWSTSHRLSTEDRVVTIEGCGFRTYSEVTCMWDDKWASPKSWIADDGTVYCVIPDLEVGDYETLPIDVPLHVIWDGDFNKKQFVGPWNFGPACHSVSGRQGPVNGYSVTINGVGFNEFETATVLIDNLWSADGSIGADGTTVTFNSGPGGNFNQWSMLNVMFDGHDHIVVHCVDTIHYGPVIEAVTPNCGLPINGRTITITGDDLNDSSLNENMVDVEFEFNNGTRFVTMGQRSGSGVTVRAPRADWGAQATVKVIFDWDYTYEATNGVSITYGPTFSDDFSPEVGWVIPNGNNDQFTVFGCGFDLIDEDDVILTFQGTDSSEDPQCASVDIPSSSQIVCNQYPARSDCDTQVVIDIEFDTPDDEFTYQFTHTDTFYQAPDPLRIDHFRGPYTAPNTGSVTWTGSRLHKSEDNGGTDWASVQCNWAAPGANTNTGASFQTSSGGSYQCDVPSADFNADGTVTLDFGSECDVTETEPYHWGPICTNINPVCGSILGGQSLDLTGEGFDDYNAYNDVDVYFCTDRLDPTFMDNDGCPVVEDSPNSDTRIGVTTPAFAAVRDGEVINRDQSGIRLFGDLARLEIHFAPGTASGHTDNIIECRHPVSGDRLDFRWGPCVTSVNSNWAEYGPRDGYNRKSITVSGVGFSDNFLNGDVFVGIGHVGDDDMGLLTKGSLSSNSVSTSTQWGGDPNSAQDVHVFFDTCNRSMTDQTVHWGPVISHLEYNAQIGNSVTYNMWGVKPWGNEVVTVHGDGFSEFATEIECVINDIEAPATYVDDDTVTCVTPRADFYTNATVLLRFDRLMRDTAEPDWSRAIYAPQHLAYRPRIDHITPSRGHVSGKGDPDVTIHGLGFHEWDDATAAASLDFPAAGSIKCFFGGAETPYVSHTTTEVVCKPPIFTGDDDPVAGAGWYDDDQDSVYVSVQLYGGDRTGDSVHYDSINYDWRMVVPELYTYGPVCTGVSPSRLEVTPTDEVSIVGTFFDDDVVVDSVKVFWNNNNITDWISATSGDISDGAILAGIPPEGNCKDAPDVRVDFRLLHNFPNEIRRVECPANSFIYGPVVTDLLVGGDTEYYGWIGAEATLTGSLFDDPDLFVDETSVTVTFGGSDAEVVSVSGSEIEVIVPSVSNPWQKEVSVQVSWSGGNEACNYGTAHPFFYGAELVRITPNQGYVAGNDAVGSTNPASITVTGTGFECDECRFEDNTECLWFTGSSITGRTSASKSGSSYTCDVLPNDSAMRVRSVGLAFNTTGTERQATRSSSLVQYLYGPSVTAIDTDVARIAGGSLVTFIGQFLDDDWFTYGTGDTLDVLAGSNVLAEGRVLSANAIEFTVPEWGGASCGDVEDVKPRWDMTGQPAAQSNSCSANSQFCLGDTFRYRYGNPDATASGTFRYNTTANSENGGTETTVTVGPFNTEDGSDTEGWFDYLEVDYAVSAGQTFLCVWTSTEDSEHHLFSKTTGSTTSVTCPVPDGPFFYDAKLWVVLAPKHDYATVLGSAFRWVPYALEWSCPFVAKGEEEERTVYGGGFMYYDNSEQGTVLCTFGSNEASQADLTDDWTLVCRTPSVSEASTVSVRLDFCDHTSGVVNNEDNWCGCDTLGSNGWDHTTVRESFTFAGINTHEPMYGPIEGDTQVYIKGFGFHLWDSVDGCYFGSNPGTMSNFSTDGTEFVCTTDDRADAAVVDVTVDVTINGVQYTLHSPYPFDFGHPSVVDVTPTSANIDSDTTFTITGDYFNGGVEWRCNVNGQAFDAEWIDFETIECTVSEDAVDSIGVYFIEVSYDGSEFTTDHFPISWTQAPVVKDIEPSGGSFLGGETVSIFGDNFNGGTVLLARFDDVVTSCRLEDGSAPAEPTPSPTPGCSNSTVNGTCLDARMAPVRRVVRGINDALVCSTPRHVFGSYTGSSNQASTVKVSISLDGKSFTETNVNFEYRLELPDDTPGIDGVCPAGTITPLSTLVTLALGLLVVLMF